MIREADFVSCCACSFNALATSQRIVVVLTLITGILAFISSIGMTCLY